MSDLNGNGAPESRTPVMPVPTEFQLQQVQMNDGSLMIVLNLYTATGIHSTFWPGEMAQVLGMDLTKYGQATAAGVALG